jgi:lipid II:glycine glycyltransferase (peptidoglycan interpeptide bridge formation enzyme)
VVGLFRTDREGPEALLAFAWGCAHGDQVEYNAAASTRNPEVRLPMAYALAWDLMRWGKSTGAEQFDFGGITAGTHGEEDRLGGISDFKRYFTTMEREVGAEWVLEPRPLRAAVASAVSAGAAWASRLAHR